MTPQAIGGALTQRRKARGLSQRELGERTGLSKQTVTTIETGTGNPRLASLLAYADALDMEWIVVPREAADALKSRMPGAPAPQSEQDVVLARLAALDHGPIPGTAAAGGKARARPAAKAAGNTTPTKSDNVGARRASKGRP
jgi:transcriptional regulator with XRE-family HTH domain